MEMEAVVGGVLGAFPFTLWLCFYLLYVRIKSMAVICSILLCILSVSVMSEYGPGVYFCAMPAYIAADVVIATTWVAGAQHKHSKIRPVLSILGLCSCGLINYAPQIVFFCNFGTLEMSPQAISFYALSEVRIHHTRHLGASRFADEKHYRSAPLISQQYIDAYFKEGYIIIRDLLPSDTVAAFRDELLLTMGDVNRYLAHQSQFRVDASLDFLLFSPLGHVAAQIMGTYNAHLIYSHYRFRINGLHPETPGYHADSRECSHTRNFQFTETGSFFWQIPSREEMHMPIKFQIPLYDDMPGLRLVNVTGLQVMYAYTNGEWNEDVAEFLIVKPQLSLGDVIVHTPCLPHRSPKGVGGRPSGWIGPSYAPSSFRFFNRQAELEQQCEAGIPFDMWADAHLRDNGSSLPPLFERYRWCYPQAYPLDAVHRQKGTFQMDFKLFGWHKPWTVWYTHAWNDKMGEAFHGVNHGSLQPHSSNEVPPDHVIKTTIKQ